MRACNATMLALDGKLPSACEFLAIGEALFALHGRMVKGGSASENHHVFTFQGSFGAFFSFAPSFHKSLYTT